MDLGNMGFILVPVPAALLVLATSLAARPGVLLPRWLARPGQGRNRREWGATPWALGLAALSCSERPRIGPRLAGRCTVR